MGRPCAQEAQLLSKLRHPNIIAYKESFLTDADRTLCIVTAFAEVRHATVHVTTFAHSVQPPPPPRGLCKH